MFLDFFESTIICYRVIKALSCLNVPDGCLVIYKEFSENKSRLGEWFGGTKGLAQQLGVDLSQGLTQPQVRYVAMLFSPLPPALIL